MKIKCLLRKGMLCMSLTLGLFVCRVNAQSHYFSHYQVENGLSNNAVICSYQDKKGFLWFGTKDGLNRFDGISFKIFRNDPRNIHSLGNNSIVNLFEDNHETLWVGTERGLYLYHPLTETFDLFPGTRNETIRAITMDHRQNLWFVSGFNLFRYSVSTDSIDNEAELIAHDINTLCTTEDGVVWMTTTSGHLAKLDAKNDAFSLFDLFNKSVPASTHWIEKIFDTEQGSILIATSSQGVKRFDIATNSYRDILTYNPNQTEIYARDFIHHSGDEYWIATETGIFIYNLKTDIYTNIRKQFNDSYSLADNAVYNFCKDKEGGIWIGTYFGGVNYYPRQYTPFEKFFPKVNVNAICGNAVREIRVDKNGNMWIGTEDAGLSKLDISTGLFTNFKPEPGTLSISNTNIHGLLVTGDTVWIGTFKRGLDLMNINTGKIIGHYNASDLPNTFKSNFIYSMIRTQYGKIIICTDQGLYEYDKKHNNFNPIFSVPRDLFYTTVFEDSKGMIWAGTYRDGLYYFNPHTGVKGKLMYEPKAFKSAANNRVNSLFEDSRGGLWLATETGLFRLNKSLKQYTTRDGFPSNVIYSMLEDDDKNLWLSTSKGLVRLNPFDNTIKIFTKSHGLLSDQFNYNSAFKTADGRMYFGSVKGMISFHPEEFITNRFISPVFLTGFQVQNKELAIQKKGSPLEKSITYTDKIELDHNQSSFNIDFAALTYTVPEMTEYAYKMEGIDKNWNFLKSYRKVFFTELAPGHYTFKVKAANSSGIWNHEERKLAIIIRPPFWASPGAYVFYAMVILAGIVVITRHYHKKSEEKHRRRIELMEIHHEKEIYEAKIDFFTNVAHEIKTPLTLIKGPLEKIISIVQGQLDIKNYLRIMEKNTNRLIDLTNEILDFRKTESKRFILNLENADISELVEDQFTNFKPVADQKDLFFNLTLPSRSLFAQVDVEAFNKILTNLFNNAVKYAKSKVLVDLSPMPGNEAYLIIQVSNDGHLIPYEMKDKIFEAFFRLRPTERQQGSGIGLSIARSLAELHSGTLELVESEEDMNVFLLRLPVSSNRKSTKNNTVSETSYSS